ncbi:MAG: cobaltochelatase subunit CobN, partial [Burkholderiaceae bacterium]|nr:cobaltochelatase subunit CobN [Burkholderiaceae bacterium]
MKPRPTSAADRIAAPVVRVVVVTLDSHLASACERAQHLLLRELPGLRLSLHAAAEWNEDPEALARCQADIAQGDIVIVTMMFMEDHMQAVLPALRARRDQCDAMICCMSAAEVVKLTRVGRFDMSNGGGGPLALLKKLRGNTGSDSKRQGSSGAQQLKMLRRIPKLLRFIPGTAQDVRAYFLTLAYWLAGSDDNVANLVRYLVDRYAGGERAVLRGKLKYAGPAEYPEVGVYHPRLKERITDEATRLPARRDARGTVGLLVLRSYVLAGNSAHYDGVIAAMEAQGINVVPAFSSGLDSRPAIERFFMREGRSTVDALVSLTGFSLVGGPAYNDAHAAEEVLRQLDVPYTAAHPVEFQTIDQWAAGERGLMPVENTIMVAIPELDGATDPMVFGGRITSDGKTARCAGCARKCSFDADRARDMHACSERAGMLARRIARQIELRRTPVADRRIALVIFNFPPNAGNTGTAAHLAVFESLHHTLSAMHAAGYAVEVPATVDELRERIIHGNAERFGSVANIAARISADDHVRREPHLQEIEAAWGPAPGKQLADGASIHVLGAHFGNAFV